MSVEPTWVYRPCDACGRRYDAETDHEGFPLNRWCTVSCELHARGFGALELRRIDSGWRHYLQGEPVHCGTTLDLAPVSADPCPRVVRYESPLALTGDREPPALLWTEVAGHEAVITAHSGMRLRWPARER